MKPSLSPAFPLLRTLVIAGSFLGLTACQGVDIDSRPWQKQEDGTWSRENPEDRETIFGKGGLNLFGSGKADEADTSGSGLNVNAFLWRASLDTVAFMPLTSADPFGGVIITDWYQPPESPQERFKVNVYILGRALRSDGLKVSVFRQVQNGAGEWTDAVVAPGVATDLENAMLTRARQLRTAEVR